jgi:predicted O-methyltransferase YrrM
MHFIDEKLEAYCEVHSTSEENYLKNINRDTYAKVLNPRMLSGHLQGRFLAMMSKMISPVHILEIGTFTGYSALCLAEGLASSGKLITIEYNPELEDKITENFKNSPYSQSIQLVVGDAMEEIPKLPHAFQLVFIDADKSNYLNYYHLVWDKLAFGGYIIADNVLWNGKVVEPINDDDEDTKAIIRFNQHVVTDKRAECIMLPVRDGLTVIRKKYPEELR